MPKFTQMGSTCTTLVSSTLGPDTSVPSEGSARVVIPETGASTRVYSRFRFASVSRACAALTSAAPIASDETASSYSFWLTAFSA